MEITAYPANIIWPVGRDDLTITPVGRAKWTRWYPGKGGRFAALRRVRALFQRERGTHQYEILDTPYWGRQLRVVRRKRVDGSFAHGVMHLANAATYGPRERVVVDRRCADAEALTCRAAGRLLRDGMYQSLSKEEAAR